MALVPFHLRSFGVCLDFLNLSLASALFFSLSTVRTLAIAFLTTYIEKIMSRGLYTISNVLFGWKLLAIDVIIMMLAMIIVDLIIITRLIANHLHHNKSKSLTLIRANLTCGADETLEVLNPTNSVLNLLRLCNRSGSSCFLSS